LCISPALFPVHYFGFFAVTAFEIFGLLIAAVSAPWFYASIRVPQTSFIGGLTLTVYTTIEQRLYLNSFTYSTQGTTIERFESLTYGFKQTGRAALALFILAILSSFFVLLVSATRTYSLWYKSSPTTWAASSVFLWLYSVHMNTIVLLTLLTLSLTTIGLALGCTFISSGNTGYSPIDSSTIDHTGQSVAIVAFISSIILLALAYKLHLLDKAGELPLMTSAQKAIAVSNPLTSFGSGGAAAAPPGSAAVDPSPPLQQGGAAAAPPGFATVDPTPPQQQQPQPPA
jgi:hypothetical protein